MEETGELRAELRGELLSMVAALQNSGRKERTNGREVERELRVQLLRSWSLYARVD